MNLKIKEDLTMNGEKGALVLIPEGRIDSANSAAWEKEMTGAIAKAEGRKIVLDFSDLTYISSAGLRVLLRLKNLPGGPAAIRNVSPEVYDILELTGFTSLFEVSRQLRRISVDGCEIIGQGTFGTIYRLDPDTVVKVYHTPDALTMIENEQQLAKKALLSGIPTAISYDVVQVGSTYGSVFELIKAQTLSDYFRNHPEDEDRTLQRYARVIRSIHDVRTEPGKLLDARQIYLSRLEELRDILPEETAARLNVLLRAMPEHLYMIHGDPQMRNVMYSKDEPILIDMDMLCAGDPVFDFAPLFVTYEAFPEDEPANSMRFAGIPNNRYLRVWKQTLRFYLGSPDDRTLQEAMDKVRTVGYIRFLHLVGLKDVGDPSLKAVRIRHALKHLEELVSRVNSLTLRGEEPSPEHNCRSENSGSIQPLRSHCPMEIPSQIAHLASLFTEAGFEIYLVGGCVRDMVLGRKPNDYDFTTSATGEEILALCKKNKLACDDRFLFLQYVPVLLGEAEEQKIDVSHFHGRSLKEDLQARDLTINSLAYDIAAQEIVDHTGGLSDTHNKIIRFNRPLTPDKSGDILRALRFCLELGFSIDPDTYDLMQQSVGYFENIRTSTLIKGMTKLLAGARETLTR